MLGRAVRRPFGPLIVLCALATALAASDARADDAPARDPKARALELFEQSAVAYREGRFQAAIDLLLEARRTKPEPVLLYNLGRAYEALGDQKEAADAYARYLAEEPRAGDRRAIEARVVTLRAQAERLERAKSPPDGRAERPEPEPGVGVVMPWVVTGVGLAGLGTGVVLALVSRGRHDAAVREPVQAAAQDKQDAASTFATGATVAFIAGGVVTAAGLTWLGIRAFTPSPRGVALLPGPGTLSLTGTF
jgi:tetratricopeptide (TPR) repeat protein